VTDTLDLAASVRAVLLRDLRGLRREVEAYPDEASLWALPPGAPNSAGTLVLHLTGNLQHFLGAVLGGTGYVRDRDAEFADRNVPRAELLRRIAAAEAAVERGLPGKGIPAEYPAPAGGGGMRVRSDEWLVHLVAHLAYHLGQVDLHRRLSTTSTAGVGTIPTTELPSARTP
jgi:hypothetical protein